MRRWRRTCIRGLMLDVDKEITNVGEEMDSKLEKVDEVVDEEMEVMMEVVGGVIMESELK